jgi:hypothetical protein
MIVRWVNNRYLYLEVRQMKYCVDRQLRRKKMTCGLSEYGLNIQTISTKRTDKQANRVLLLGQLKEKADASHF